MKFRNSAAAAALLAPLLLFPYAAHADQAWENADVVCSQNSEIAVIRFGMSWNDDPPQYVKLPATLDAGLSTAPASKQQKCRLPSGRAVRVRYWSAEAQAHGVGGGDPESFYDLWVGSRKVRSKQQWKPRGFINESWTSAVIVRGHQLITCTRPKEDAHTTCSRPELQ